MLEQRKGLDNIIARLYYHFLAASFQERSTVTSILFESSHNTTSFHFVLLLDRLDKTTF